MCKRIVLSSVVAVFFCAFAVPRADSAIAAPRVALVIGNGAYQNVPRLPNPPRDAGDVADSLTRLGFAVTRSIDQTGDAMRRALVEFGRVADGADMAVVFYAGHGMEIGGENWLIPVDAELRNDTDADGEAISLRAVTLQVGKARQLGLVILDACRNNPFAAKMQRSLRTRAVTRGLAPTEPTDNVLVAYSAKDGTTANDGDGRNSPFTTALLRNIETPGLEVTFMFRAVRDEVMASTNREQQPFVYGSLSREAIYLKPPVAGGAPPVAAATSTDAAQAWEAVKNSSDPAAIESFLRYYGDGFYGDLARSRLAQLKKQAVVASLPPQRSLTAQDGQSSAQFGGAPYCKYSVTLKNPQITATADERGSIASASLALIMVEDVVPPCQFAPLGTKRHNYTGSGAIDGTGAVSLSFVPANDNMPKATATFSGTIVDGRLVGTLSVRRSDQSGNLAWTVGFKLK
jgi:hypothetical protein